MLLKMGVRICPSFWYQMALSRVLAHGLKGLMNKTIAVHVRFKSLYISFPSYEKQQRGVTKFCVFWRTRTAISISISIIYLPSGTRGVVAQSPEPEAHDKSD